MKSENFEFLRPCHPELADVAAFAEQYTHPDPSMALVKLRMFGEQLTAALYDAMSLPIPFSDSFADRLGDVSFSKAVPSDILDRLHYLRKTGNKAAHGHRFSTRDAVTALNVAHQLASWHSVRFLGTQADQIPSFVTPSAPLVAGSSEKEERERAKLLERLARQEAELQKLVVELEEARKKTTAAAKTEAELQALLAAGRQTASELRFDEKTTRELLIDQLLVEAGWAVAPGLESTEHVCKEEEVAWQPTDSGRGSADYALKFDDDEVYAVIEAKKTSEDVQKGRTQAQCYADGFEKDSKKGIRPVIFCTNGYQIEIWNDAAGEPPRPVYGFYSKDSLQYLHHKRANAMNFTEIPFPQDIALRDYQELALKQIMENFDKKKRKALVVQATGTGKTVLAVGLCAMLIRAERAKRILFLCDRVELRRQANNKFNELLPGIPRTIVTASTAQDRNQRIYLATYPTMMKWYASFDVGFFDVIIADESHRSIYNRYKSLFTYFDALQVGLTATPRREIHTHTYRMFDCPPGDPTAYYGLEEAVSAGKLVPFRVKEFRPELLVRGIKYPDLKPEQKESVDDSDDPASINYDPRDMDRSVLNKDTNRQILRNLMENGIRDATGSHPGKSIIFARNHNHAVLLEKLFNEMYPQYGGTFCRVIDNYDPRAEKLIDDFKDPNNRLTVAISVDMLDTGIDAPEVVNLVFAKPVWSKTKFWQMIGRGTRLRPGLFGPGKDKTEFFIFDHWENFRYFDEQYKPAEAAPSKSLLHRLFETRLGLAEAALKAQDVVAFKLAATLLREDILALPEKSVAVREKWKQVKTVSAPEVLEQFDASTVRTLRLEIAPLMQWRSLVQDAAAYQFDTLMARLQTERLRGSADYTGLADEAREQIGQLRVNLNQVQAKEATLKKVRPPQFWDGATVADLEDLRTDLRSVMQHRAIPPAVRTEPRVLDIPEDVSEIQAGEYKPKDLAGIDQAAYRQRVEGVLKGLLQANPTLQKIKAGHPVSAGDLETLVKLVLVQDPLADLTMLREFFPDTAGHLDHAIRRIIGLDAEAVEKVFADFTQQHLLNSRQLNFLRILKTHIRNYGAVRLDELYQPPFTTLHTESVDGVFPPEQVDALLGILDRFKPSTSSGVHPTA